MSKRIIQIYFSLTALSLISISTASCQPNISKKFNWEVIRLGYVLPLEKGLNGAISLSTEPFLLLSPKFSIGLKNEVTFFKNSNIQDIAFRENPSWSITIINSYHFNGNSKNGFQMGTGLGIFRSGSVLSAVDDQNILISSKQSLIAIQRIGYFFGQFKTSFEFNAVPFNNLNSNFSLNLGIIF